VRLAVKSAGGVKVGLALRSHALLVGGASAIRVRGQSQSHAEHANDQEFKKSG
jgi:hypothetical protein